MSTEEVEKWVDKWDEYFYEQTARAREYYSDGYDEWGLSNFEDALKYFRKSVKCYPEDVSAVYMVGNTLYKLERYEEAIKWSQKSKKINPSHINSYFQIGCSYMKLFKFEEAIPEFIEMTRIDPKDYQSYNNLAVTYLLIKEYKKAIETLKKNLELNPTFNLSYYNLAICYIKRKKLSKAQIMIEKGSESSQEYRDFGYYCEGMLNYKNGLYKEATAKFDIAVGSSGVYGVRDSLFYYYGMSIRKMIQTGENPLNFTYDNMLEKFDDSLLKKWSKPFYRKGEYYLQVDQLNKAKEAFQCAIDYSSLNSPNTQLSDAKIQLIRQHIQYIDNNIVF